jgi:hypothetical protein
MIRCSNGSGWISNEYPNAVTPVLKRNDVFIIGQEKVSVEDNLHGGRPGVHFSCAFNNNSTTSTTSTMKIRMFNDAQEAYIDHGNYRISYFLYDTAITAIADTVSKKPGWCITPQVSEGIDISKVRLLHEMLPDGQDTQGKWNQRLIIQFFDPATDTTNRENYIVTTNYHLDWYRGVSNSIHRGGTVPLHFVFDIHSTDLRSRQWDADWSWNGENSAVDGADYFPVGPDFTEPSPGNNGIEVERLNPKHCQTVEQRVENILVEEWDGYTWRKVFGNAPRMSNNMKIPLTIKAGTMSVNRISRSSVFFTLPSAENVCLQMIDIKGRVISTIVNGHLRAGNHSAKLNRNLYSSSIVILKLTSPDKVVLSKMVNIR